MHASGNFRPALPPALHELLANLNEVGATPIDITALASLPNLLGLLLNGVRAYVASSFEGLADVERHLQGLPPEVRDEAHAALGQVASISQCLDTALAQAGEVVQQGRGAEALPDIENGMTALLHDVTEALSPLCEEPGETPAVHAEVDAGLQAFESALQASQRYRDERGVECLDQCLFHLMVARAEVAGLLRKL